MRVVITGANGQLGRAVGAAFAAVTGAHVERWDVALADVTDPAIRDTVSRSAPDVVINCAAWTDVDGAEARPEDAFAANALGPLYLAEGCAACGAAMVHISSNEVFAGEPGRFYFEYDQTAPGSVYARSKLAGERAAAQVLASLYVVRVAWLYGPGGNHFPGKIMAAADRHGALRVVDDEFGNPTYAPDVAAALVRLVQTERYGVYHLVNEGFTNRHGLAQAVLARTGRGHVPVSPIKLHEWPRATQPPAHAVLVNQAAAKLGIRLRTWQQALDEYLHLEHGVAATDRRRWGGDRAGDARMRDEEPPKG